MPGLVWAWHLQIIHLFHPSFPPIFFPPLFSSNTQNPVVGRVYDDFSITHPVGEGISEMQINWHYSWIKVPTIRVCYGTVTSSLHLNYGCTNAHFPPNNGKTRISLTLGLSAVGLICLWDNVLFLKLFRTLKGCWESLWVILKFQLWKNKCGSFLSIFSVSLGFVLNSCTEGLGVIDNVGLDLVDFNVFFHVYVEHFWSSN